MLDFGRGICNSLVSLDGKLSCKPLLKVGDKTILDWLVDDIDTAGLVDTYVVISNHKYAYHFENWAATKKQNIQVVDDGTSSNETRLGAVCDVQFAIDQAGAGR